MKIHKLPIFSTPSYQILIGIHIFLFSLVFKKGEYTLQVSINLFH